MNPSELFDLAEVDTVTLLRTSVTAPISEVGVAVLGFRIDAQAAGTGPRRRRRLSFLYLGERIGIGMPWANGQNDPGSVVVEVMQCFSHHPVRASGFLSSSHHHFDG